LEHLKRELKSKDPAAVAAAKANLAQHEKPKVVEVKKEATK
jgi:hypothetical protein